MHVAESIAIIKLHLTSFGVLMIWLVKMHSYRHILALLMDQLYVLLNMCVMSGQHESHHFLFIYILFHLKSGKGDS